jgi:sugar phosphate permease
METKTTTSSPGYRWVILGVCWLAYIVAFMQRLSIGPLAPFIKEELNLSSAQAGLFMSAAAFGYMLTLTPAGWLVDRIGVRWLLLVGEMIGGIFVANMFMVKSFTHGLILMALAGMGLGCIMPSTTKAVLEWFPARERATAMGLKQTSINVAGIITATTLPVIALALSWRYGFLFMGITAMGIGIVSFLFYKQPPPMIPSGAGSPVIRAEMGHSIVTLFGSRDIWLVIGAGVCFLTVEFSVILYFILYLKDVFLFSVVAAGFFLALLESGGAFGKPITGLLSDRLFSGSRKRVFILMCCIGFATCMLFAHLRQGTPSWILASLCVICGFVCIGWGGLFFTLIGEFAGRELAGTATGLTTALLLLANMGGPPLFGYIADTTGSFRIAWYYLASLSLIAATFLAFVHEEKREV